MVKINITKINSQIYTKSKNLLFLLWKFPLLKFNMSKPKLTFCKPMLSPVLSLWMYLFLMFRQNCWDNFKRNDFIPYTLSVSLQALQRLPPKYWLEYPWLSSLNVTTLIHVLVKLAGDAGLDIFHTQLSRLCESTAFRLPCLSFQPSILPGLATLYPSFMPHLLPHLFWKFWFQMPPPGFLHSSWTLVVTFHSSYASVVR